MTQTNKQAHARSLLHYVQKVALATAHIEPPAGVKLNITSAFAVVYRDFDVVEIANNILQSNPITLHLKENHKTT